jgi:RNA polymerase sigma-70 factor (ECF subfamily)
MLTSETIAAVLLAERLPLTAYIAAVTRDFHRAEDIFQEVCVKAIGLASEFASETHALRWARVAGRNRAFDILRRDQRHPHNLGDELLETLAEEWPGSQDAETACATHAALSDCIQTLTPNNRELLRLRYFEGRSGAEVASALGRKLETVYQALARLHKSLGECVRARLREGAAS